MRISLRSIIRAALAWDPVVFGWARRFSLKAGFGEKNESDYLFDVARSQRDVFVLQVGANDGQRHDELNPFIHRCRWRGLLLEPLPDVFTILQSNYAGRKNITLVNAALSDRDGEMTLYRVRPGPDVPGHFQELASFYRDQVVKHGSALPEIDRHVIAETVKAISFPALVREHCIERIDVMVIDAEGYDFEILKMMDIRLFRPRLVLYEHFALSGEDRDSAALLLASLGYKVYQIRNGNGNTAAVYETSQNPSTTLSSCAGEGNASGSCGGRESRCK
ncbi:MAG: FkbM family methyltransferase [Terracidiphilus sp.]